MSNHPTTLSPLARVISDSSGPWKRVVEGSAGEVYDAVIAADGHPAPVRILCGKRCVNVLALFHELAAALQFPPSFGGNWDAALDCLRDVRDRHASGLTLVVLDAARLLSAEPDKRSTFEGILDQARRDADEKSSASRSKPIRVILQGV